MRWTFEERVAHEAGLSLAQIADEVGSKREYVRAILLRLGLAVAPAERPVLPWLAKARKMRARGASLQAIASVVGVSLQRVHAVLRRPAAVTG